MKDHLEHQVRHKSDTCKCSDWKPLHMFISGVGGTGKSFLIKTILALLSEIWHDKTESLLCAVTSPTGLLAFNVGGITVTTPPHAIHNASHARNSTQKCSPD